MKTNNLSQGLSSLHQYLYLRASYVSILSRTSFNNIQELIITSLKEMSMLRLSVKTILSTMTIAILSLPLAISAADSSSGCGLGWMLLKENSLVSSSFRATTNAMFSSTIGMTLGTSGCAKHKIVKLDKKEIHYAEVNFDHLLRDFSMGKGQFAKNFAAVLGCDQGMQKEFSKHMQLKLDYENIHQPQELLERVHAELERNPKLKGRCNPPSLANNTVIL